MFQLRFDTFNAGDLLRCLQFDTGGVMAAKLRLRELRDGMNGKSVEPFAKFLEHFNGGADLINGRSCIIKCDGRGMTCDGIPVESSIPD